MTTITIPKKQLKTLLKEGVREVFEQEIMNLRALILPYVSSREQKEIEKKYGKPSRKSAKRLKTEICI